MNTQGMPAGLFLEDNPFHMNKYLLIFLIIHGLILMALALNIMVCNYRLTRLKDETTVKNTAWTKNYARTRYFFIQSILSFSVTLAGEALSVWLLWMAGAFEVCN